MYTKSFKLTQLSSAKKDKRGTKFMYNNLPRITYVINGEGTPHPVSPMLLDRTHGATEIAEKYMIGRKKPELKVPLNQ